MSALLRHRAFQPPLRVLDEDWPQQNSGRAKGAAKGSCGETVVQKGVFGESVSSLLPQGFQDLSGVLRANLKGAEKKRTLQKPPFGQPFLRTTPSPLLWRAPKNTASRNAASETLALAKIHRVSAHSSRPCSCLSLPPKSPSTKNNNLVNLFLTN